MSKIIVALDNLDVNQAVKLANKLKGKVWGFKINDLLACAGKTAIEYLKNSGKVFADPKLYDIPNTVANTIRHYADSGADLITVHASGGISMMRRAREACVGTNALVVAVTALTSFPDDELSQVYSSVRVDLVRQLASLAKAAGVFTVVCSASEIKFIKEYADEIILPAFRPPSATVKNDDQVHTAGYADAALADLVVIGRPITEAKDPVAAVEEFNAGIENAAAQLV